MFFNKSLIKYEKILSYLMQYSKNEGNDQKPRCSSCIAIEPQSSHSSYMVPTLDNVKILLSLQLFSHSAILEFYYSANWGISKPIFFFFFEDR